LEWIVPTNNKEKAEMNAIVVLVTCASEKQAGEISQKLLQQRLAACVNVVKDVSSLFHWQGKIEAAHEVLLLIKTRAELFEGVRDCVKAAHSYANPEIIALPVVAGSSEYLEWIEQETNPGNLSRRTG